MSNMHRSILRRKANQCINDYDRALKMLHLIHQEYDPTHPDWAKAIEQIAVMTTQVKEFLSAFRKNHM